MYQMKVETRARKHKSIYEMASHGIFHGTGQMQALEKKTERVLDGALGASLYHWVPEVISPGKMQTQSTVSNISLPKHVG